MVASLYTAVSGLVSQQTALDTIGNNISNIDTVGFRGSDVKFDSLLSQSLASPDNSKDSSGGYVGTINQIGLGVRVSATAMTTVQGPIKQTGNNFDLAINGNGWFGVQGPNNNLPAYTRNGEFTTDSLGNFETTQGYKVLGMKSPNLTTNSNGTGSVSTTTDPGSLLGGTASPIVLPPTLTCPGTPAIAQVIGTVPSQTLNYTTSPSGTDIPYGMPTSAPATITITNSAGTVVNTLYPQTSTAGDNVYKWDGKDSTGGNAPNGTYTINVSYVQQAGVAAVPVGNLTGYSVGNDGRITASFDNNKTAVVAQIPLYNFQNQQGLSSTGDNLYSASSNSGNAFIAKNVVTGVPMNPSPIQAGAVETSNVSFSDSMTNLIITQRAYDANAKCVTTSDQLIQKAIALKN